MLKVRTELLAEEPVIGLAEGETWRLRNDDERLTAASVIFSRPKRPRHPEADVVVARFDIGLGANGRAQRAPRC